MTSEGRAETLSPVGTQKAGTRAVSCRFPRYGFHPYTRETHTWKRLVHNGGGDEEQLVVASHCEINEFFTMGTLTAAGWVSRSVEPFMTMMRPIPRNDRNTIEWASWVGCNEKHGGEKKKKKRRGRLRTGANFTSRSCVIRVGEEIVEIEPRIVIHRENYVKKSGQLLSGKNSFWKNDLFNFFTADLSRWFFLTYLKIRCASRRGIGNRYVIDAKYRYGNDKNIFESSNIQ